MNTTYEIIVKRTSTIRKMVEGEYEVIDERPYTDEEVQNMNTYDSLKYKDNPEQFPIKNIRGYTPERELNVTEETEIYRQTVEELDLPTVIKAINKLP